MKTKHQEQYGSERSVFTFLFVIVCYAALALLSAVPLYALTEIAQRDSVTIPVSTPAHMPAPASTPGVPAPQEVPDIIKDPSVVIYPNPCDGTVTFYNIDEENNPKLVLTGVTGKKYSLPYGNYRIVVHNKGGFFHYWHVEMPKEHIPPGQQTHEFWPKQSRMLKWNRIIAIILLIVIVLAAVATNQVLKFKKKKEQELLFARTAATTAGATRIDGIPQTIGKFAVIERIGQGGMATVFKVQDSFGDVFALKVPHSHIFNIPEFRQRFLREAEIVKSLHHPNIVRMYDYSLGEDYTIPYIAFEFVTGMTLKQFIEKNPALAIKRAAGFIIDIASALSYAHSKGVIHRDLKPENIMVGKSFEIKLMDLGIARATDSQKLTRTDATLGTPGYIAPEQIESREIDHRCDLYSLGIMLYELLTAKLPFVSAEPINVILMHLKEPPPPPRLHNAHIPVALEDIVLKLLEKDPANRIQTADELIAVLKPFLR
jgi:tRNA A-37 threonylcarbamoyl transferase component Bud32